VCGLSYDARGGGATQNGSAVNASVKTGENSARPTHRVTRLSGHSSGRRGCPRRLHRHRLPLTPHNLGIRHERVSGPRQPAKLASPWKRAEPAACPSKLTDVGAGQRPRRRFSDRPGNLPGGGEPRRSSPGPLTRRICQAARERPPVCRRLPHASSCPQCLLPGTAPLQISVARSLPRPARKASDVAVVAGACDSG